MIDRRELGRRLRRAREACGLTQQQVAERLGVSRATVAQMELGNREVSSLELDRLAYLYGRDIRSFLSPRFDAEDALTVLFRADPELAGDEAVAAELRRYVALGRELSALEELLGAGCECCVPAQYPLPPPESRWEAVRQGERVAQEERSRLGLGDCPIPDMAALVEAQGVRAATVDLPEGVSGLTIREEGVGILVMVNRRHGVLRRRFSYAHEYAHVLLDGDRVGTVSRSADRGTLLEVRANAFAAAFLMPAERVHGLLACLGKGRSARQVVEVYDEEAVVRGRHHARRGPQPVQIFDVVQLAHVFGVSTQAALYRLRSLRLVREEEFDGLRLQIEQGVDRTARGIMCLPDPEAQYPPHTELHGRFMALAVAAYQQELISRAKLMELVALASAPEREVLRLLGET